MMADTVLTRTKHQEKGVASYVNGNFDRFIIDLIEWLRIPSISALSAHKGDVVHAIEFVSRMLRKLGFKTEVFPTRGQPSLYGEQIIDRALPTVLIYGHLDVQPVDPLEEWKRPPFEPWQEGDRLYGRGSADDKGQVMIHIKACEALIKTRGALPLNVKFIIEGEEEVGSPNFEELLGQRKRELQSDVIVISDTAMVGENCPTLSYATRGLVYFEVIFEGPKTDLHSGQFGGALVNPALALCQVLAAMVDRNGRVTIPGFYKGVRAISSQEKRWFKRAERFQAGELAAAAGAPLCGGERDRGLVERVWARPTFEVHGLTSGFQGEGTKTIIPSKASAKVSMRLVDDQDPDVLAKSFTGTVARLVPKGVKATVKKYEGGGGAFLEDVSTPAFQAAAQALAEIFGVDPYYERCGGSIFAPEVFKRAYPRTPVVMLGFGLPGENAHAPNEWLSLENFKRGIPAVGRFYELLSEIPKEKLSQLENK